MLLRPLLIGKNPPVKGFFGGGGINILAHVLCAHLDTMRTIEPNESGFYTKMEKTWTGLMTKEEII